MKEFKGSNFLLLLAVMLDFIYILPLTVHVFIHEKDLECFFAFVSLIAHIILWTVIVVRPFAGNHHSIRWGEDLFTRIPASVHDPTCKYHYRFSIILLLVYLSYQPIKKMINWTNKYLTIKFDEERD